MIFYIGHLYLFLWELSSVHYPAHPYLHLYDRMMMVVVGGDDDDYDDCDDLVFDFWRVFCLFDQLLILFCFCL